MIHSWDSRSTLGFSSSSGRRQAGFNLRIYVKWKGRALNDTSKSGDIEGRAQIQHHPEAASASLAIWDIHHRLIWVVLQKPLP